MSKTKMGKKSLQNIPPPSVPAQLDLSEEDLFVCDQLEDMNVILEDVESSPALKKRNKSGLVDYVKAKGGSLASGIGRISGNLLNKLVSAGMQTPLVKYLLSPSTLRKALNNDPILMETYRIILTSEPVQALMTPEAMKIVLDSATAKKIVTPEMVLTILNHDLLADFVTPETIRFIVTSEIVERILQPGAILNNMESKVMRRFLRPEIIHEIAYARFFTRLMDQDFFVEWLTTGGVRDVMTKEAVQDALECPGAKR